ncbi:MAG: penicillin acylase family protein [Defluviicoccus sp.]|nr:penicillin acylase family protein [Defluviicoccus sp.]
MPPRSRSAAAGLAIAAAGLVLSACALLAPLPKPRDVAERLEAFPTRGLPLEGRVTVYWSERQVPFIEAESDGDAAFALGLVHAHLRLGQMATARMLARGRLSEMIGPLGIDIDRGLRTLSYGRAAAEIERGMDEAALDWVRRFVDGINHYQDGAAELPHDFRVLGLEREPWTVGDVLAIGRLAGTDVNWLVWADLLKLRARDDWPELWARLVKRGKTSFASFDGGARTAAMQRLLGGTSKSGSNSVAVSGRRSATGGALIANDPHLGIVIPNLWLIAGVKSPSYHAVGLMGPGLPVFAIGRNPHIAWGGTNMRAASSDLYDVGDLPRSEIAERRERIGVRWWFDSEAVVHETGWGPIVTDTPLLADLDLPPLALKWTGHGASDEIGAMLAVSRARSFPEFRAAFDRFAVPGQNMLFADTGGNIGQVMAVRLPARSGAPADIFLDRETHDAAWGAMRSGADLPFGLNPERGFLVSANNRPAETDVPVSFFFSPDDRVRRLTALVEREATVDVAALKALQRDVYMASSAKLRDLFVARLDALEMTAAADAAGAEAIGRLRNWDGQYRRDSLGAVAFEQFRTGFVSRFYALLYGEEHGKSFASMRRGTTLLEEDIAAADEETLREALAAGLRVAAEGLNSFAGWGDMHRLGLAHPLSRIPLIGGRYRFAEAGVGGSSETVMKTAHNTTAERHGVTYGSNARHISDMSDPDANWFVLLGGQDGWFNSSTMMDQWALWRSGDYVRVPLTPSEVRATFPHALALEN